MKIGGAFLSTLNEQGIDTSWLRLKTSAWIYTSGGLDILEADDEEDDRAVNLYITPPESGLLTDEDSAEKIWGGHIDNLLGRQLSAHAEIRGYNYNEKKNRLRFQKIMIKVHQTLLEILV
ncbi:hypothetical protein LSTR_LSTR001530 [Laodelphax striatellus]|uniref:Uncharacterized protein n=1 Tax=Laodelphax striatellus TaxID=195883 RepID=A0A482XC50_LAOST|nr:hypothetical protein LSTR_LSTR001530 [Laodelphax striatellus]